MKIGIIGAGFVGRAVGKRAIRAGHDVMLSNSRGPQTLFSLRPMIGCEVGTPDQSARFGDIVVIAVPLLAVTELPAKELAGKLIIDSVNYYPERDGKVSALEGGQTTSELLASYLPGANIIKAFNAIPMTELETDGLPAGSSDRRALPLAGNDEEAKKIVKELYDSFGFDSVDAGSLSEGWRFERGMPSYCVKMTRTELETVLKEAKRD